MKSTKILSTIVLILAIVLMVNLLASQFSFRLDLTEDSQYTLSTATKDLLKDLEEPITVKAYFSEGLRPDIAKTKTDFRELLIEYAELSDGLLVYEFINPDDEEKQAQAAQAGVQSIQISIREKNEATVKQAYMGAVVQMGETTDVIPFIQPNAPIEYELTKSIKKLAVLDKPSIALIQGHGEPALQEMLQANQEISILYSLEPYVLSTEPIPDRFKTLALIRPTDSIPLSQLAQIDAFLNRGGNLLLAINTVEADLNRQSGNALNTGLETWLKNKGISVSNQFVVDANCAQVNVSQQNGFFRQVSRIKLPYIPIIQSFADHPITKGLESTVFQFVSEINYTGDASAQFTPLLFTSSQSGSQATPLYIDIRKKWTKKDLPRAAIPIGGVLEGNFGGSQNSKIVVFADGDFSVNGSQESFQQQQPDNISLLVNSIDWLSDDTGLISLRTKGIASRPIDTLEESTQELLKYLNFLLPIILVIIYGVIRSQISKSIRVKRMEESYAE